MEKETEQEMQEIGEIEHYKGCFTQTECKNYFKRLLNEVPWTKQQWKAGRFLPRKIFRYDLNDLHKVEILDHLIREVEDILECNAMGVWCNLYENGLHYTPPHQDQYGAHVVTLSFGATRKCVMQNIKTGQSVEYILDEGDIFYFSPEHDADHKHSIPKAGAKIGPRISIVIFTTKPFSGITSTKDIGDDKSLEGNFENISDILHALGYISLTRNLGIPNRNVNYSSISGQKLIDIFKFTSTDFMVTEGSEWLIGAMSEFVHPICNYEKLKSGKWKIYDHYDHLWSLFGYHESIKLSESMNYFRTTDDKSSDYGIVSKELQENVNKEINEEKEEMKRDYENPDEISINEIELDMERIRQIYEFVSNKIPYSEILSNGRGDTEYKVYILKKEEKIVAWGLILEDVVNEVLNSSNRNF